MKIEQSREQIKCLYEVALENNTRYPKIIQVTTGNNHTLAVFKHRLNEEVIEPLQLYKVPSGKVAMTLFLYAITFNSNDVIEYFQSRKISNYGVINFNELFELLNCVHKFERNYISYQICEHILRSYVNRCIEKYYEAIKYNPNKESTIWLERIQIAINAINKMEID